VVKDNKNKLQNENLKKLKRKCCWHWSKTNIWIQFGIPSSTLSKIIGSEKTNICIYKWGTDVYTSVCVFVILCMWGPCNGLIHLSKECYQLIVSEVNSELDQGSLLLKTEGKEG